MKDGKIEDSDLPRSMRDYERQLYVGLTVEHAQRLNGIAKGIIDACNGNWRNCPHCGGRL